MPTNTFKKLDERLQADGHIAIAANLLYEAVLIGWASFALLYALETLLPTFVIARLSLVKFSVCLILFTILLGWLGQLGEAKIAQTKKMHPLLLAVLGLFLLSTVMLANYRFPWWTIPISIGGYGLVAWFFFKIFQENR